MIERFAIAAFAIIGMGILWVGVQVLWKRIFRAYLSDEDALATRGGCTHCNCAGGVCKTREETETPTLKDN